MMITMMITMLMMTLTNMIHCINFISKDPKQSPHQGDWINYDDDDDNDDDNDDGGDGDDDNNAVFSNKKNVGL